MEKWLKRDIKITSIFLIYKIHQNKHAKIAPIFEKLRTLKWRQFFAPGNYLQQCTLKQYLVFVHQNYLEKRISKPRRSFANWNYIEKVRQNDVEFCRYFISDVLA